MLVTAVEKSHNAKIGMVSATYASQKSCPTTCAFYGNGCYAENGSVGFTTRRLNRATTADTTSEQVALAEAKAIDGLTGKLPLRLHVVGDCKTARSARHVARAVARYMRRFNQHVWTYTHAWRTVRRDHWGKVSVLASCETTQDVKEATARGYATAIVVDHHDSPKAYVKDGIKIQPCPEQTKGIQCTSCRLCWNDQGLRDRGVTIAFAAHSTQVNKAKQALIDRQAV